MGSFLIALQGIGDVLGHLGVAALEDPAVEQAIATLIEKMIAARAPLPVK